MMKMIAILLVTAACILACRAETAETDLPCPQMCTLEMNPQCATFVGSFSNPCELQAARCRLGKFGVYLQSSSPGQCECPGACSFIYYPVCGSDGVTYPNSCVLDIDICNGKHVGPVAMGECPP